MASGISGISGAGNFQDDVDYSIPHRPPPQPPSVTSTASPNRSPEFAQHQFAQHQQSHHQRQKSSGSGSILKNRPRKNSLGGLLRSGSSRAPHTHTPQAPATHDPLAAPPLPPPPFPAPPIPEDDPNTLFHFGDAATVRSTAYPTPPAHFPPSHSFDQPDRERTSTSIFRSRSRSKSRDGGSTMLRKSSKAKQQLLQQQAEFERQQREAHMLPKQPPRLPSHQALPGMPSFGGEDARPDSIAMFNHSAHTNRLPPHAPYTQTQTPPQSTANFSRPGNAAMASSQKDNSSSPAYALRGASASVSPPPADVATNNGEDSHGRTSSMTNRGRYSYTNTTAVQTGHVNSPRRMRRRKDPTPFNVLVVGTKNSGKSSFISLLDHSLATPNNKRETDAHPPQIKGNFTSTYLETEMEGERVGLTLWDSAGLEKGVVDLQLREMTTFIESKFEETFAEEQKVMRSPGFRDTHIHCVFLVLDPLRLDANIAASSQGKGDPIFPGASGLDDDLDLQVLRALWEKTVVVPVIAKADTLTTSHMAHLKRAVWRSIQDNSMNPLDALELEDDEEDDIDDSDALLEEDEEEEIDLPSHSADHLTTQTPIDNLLESSSSNSSTSSRAPKAKSANKRASHIRHSSQAATATDEEPYLPLSVLSPDPYSLPKSGVATERDLSRIFPWGAASPLNPQHCDFPRLRASVFLEWRGDLRELSRTRWYEQWRTSRLRNVPGTKMRVKGGVTPVAAVPKEGRGDVRNFSGPGGVPRSVSNTTPIPQALSGSSNGSGAGQGAAPVGMAVSTPATAL